MSLAICPSTVCFFQSSANERFLPLEHQPSRLDWKAQQLPSFVPMDTKEQAAPKSFSNNGASFFIKAGLLVKCFYLMCFVMNLLFYYHSKSQSTQLSH